MKTIGLIGGMSWESTVTYYQLINEAVHKRLGGLHSAKIVLWSVEFDEIEKCQSCGDWAKSASILSETAKGLEKAGADVILICTNTMHKVADEVETDKKDEILDLKEELGLGNAIQLQPDYKRYYPYGAFASSVLGFTNSEDQGVTVTSLSDEDMQLIRETCIETYEEECEINPNFKMVYESMQAYRETANNYRDWTGDYGFGFNRGE